jgi:ArsR family transcriptional regulator, arsenate/arsenite/antimonite-responsive transcriptional repressor
MEVVSVVMQVKARAKSPAGTAEPVACCSSVTEAPLSEPDAVELARVLSALSDPVRLRLLSIVASSPEVCSCELEVPLAKSQPTISHHTKILAEAGLISGEKRGRWMWWHANPSTLSMLRKALGG